MLTHNLEGTLQRALVLASERRHRYATTEHLFLALLTDEDARQVLAFSGADFSIISRRVEEILDGFGTKDNTPELTRHINDLLADRLKRAGASGGPGASRRKRSAAKNAGKQPTKTAPPQQELEDLLDPDRFSEISSVISTAGVEPGMTRPFHRAIQRAAVQVQSNGQQDVNGAHVIHSLYSERECNPAKILLSYGIPREAIANFIYPRHASHATSPPPPVAPPPPLPSQGIGPHVEITAEGVIDFPPVRALDNTGNHIERLRALHPDIRGLASELFAGLNRGNCPHATLRDRAAAYCNLIDTDLQEIDFGRLYASGVRLSNAAFATEKAVLANDLPPLEAADRERLESLLTLHGAFIMATRVGLEAMVDEERFQRRPEEERRYRSDAIAIAKLLRLRSDIIAPNVAEQMLDMVEEIGEGRNPERSTIIGRATIRNVAIMMAGGAVGSVAMIYSAPVVGLVATYLGLLAISETIKKTYWFKSITQSMATNVDNALDKSSADAKAAFRRGLLRQRSSFEANEGAWRRFAGDRKELEFVHRALDWLKSQPNH